MRRILNWYVITGAPSSGITSVLDKLSDLGFCTIPETARVLIDQEISEGKSLEEIRKDEGEFQRRVLKMKIDVENNAPKDRIVFFDRGIPDSIAYFQVCGLNSNEVIKLCQEKRYTKIFMLKQLPYKKDYARVEDEKLAEKLNHLLHTAYSDLGYEVITIPVMPVEDRVKIILSHIEKI